MLNYFVNVVNLSHTNSVQQLHFWSEFWETAHLLVFWEAPLHPENVQEWISWCKVSPKKLKLKKQKCGFRPLCGWRIRWCLCPSACSRCHCHSDHSAVTLVVRLFIRLCSKRIRSIRRLAMPPCLNFPVSSCTACACSFSTFVASHTSRQLLTLKTLLKTGQSQKWEFEISILWSNIKHINSLIQHVAKLGFLHQFLTLSQVSSRCHPNFIGTTATKDLAKRLQFNIQQQRLSSCQAVKPCRHADMQCDMQTCCSGLLWC